MKLKKLWLTLLVLVMSIACAFACIGLAACDNSNPPTPDTDNTDTDNTDDDTDEDDKNDGDDTDGDDNTDGDDTDEDNKDDDTTPEEPHVHEYETTTWSGKDETGHWHLTTCGHDDAEDVKFNVEPHSYDSEFICTVCGYQHEHTYEKTWSGMDDAGHWHLTTCDHDDEVNFEIVPHAYDSDYVCTVCEYQHEHKYVNGICSCGKEDPTVDFSTEYSGKIYFVGDSTVCDFGTTDKGRYIPRYGYGTQLYNYINTDASNIVDLALSGRSSYSFISETQYTTFSTQIKAGDYVIIGFGHNDEKREVARYSDPTLASSDNSTMIGSYDAQRAVSFKYILKTYYIDVALKVGATPILCTPIVRLSTDSSKYESDHITTTTSATDTTSTPNVTTTWNGGNYAQAIRELGEELGLAVVDLTALTKADYTQLGYDEASKYHSYSGAKWADDEKTTIEPTTIDTTHTNLYGAKMNAYYIACAIKESSLGLSKNVKTNITKPTYEENASEMVNSSYIIPDQEPFNPETDASTYWKGIDGVTTDETTSTDYKWYGTAFGGGNVALDNRFTITQGTDTNGVTFKIAATSSGGKIQSTDDSLVAVFIQIPYETELNISAQVTLDAYTGASQSGFGMMLRDDIYIDYKDTVSSNYINAGAYCTSSAQNICYSRVNGALSTGDKGTLSQGQTYDVSISRTSQSITARFGSYSYNAVPDFDLSVSDGEYVYVCLWATRGTTVTFSNIKLSTSEWTRA